MPNTPTPIAAHTLCMHPIYARLLCAELLRRGCTREGIVQGLECSWSSLHESQGYLSWSLVQALVHRAQDLTQDSRLGWSVGQRTQLSAHGTIGFAVVTAPSLKVALDLVMRYNRQRQILVDLEWEVLRQGARLRIHDHIHDPVVRRYVLLHLLGALSQLVEAVTGDDVLAQSPVDWPFSQNELQGIELAQSERARFDARCWQVQLSDEHLLMPCLAADPALFRRAVQDCERERLHGHTSTWTHKVQSRLADCEARWPQLAEMAMECHVSVRTLVRRLQGEGTSYQKLLDEARLQLAQRLLQETDWSVDRIALQMGYADGSNFSRLFRRWQGCTPGQWRSRRQA